MVENLRNVKFLELIKFIIYYIEEYFCHRSVPGYNVTLTYL